jgi:hypothetical protein
MDAVNTFWVLEPASIKILFTVLVAVVLFSLARLTRPAL